jgi:hypothetical protein
MPNTNNKIPTVSLNKSDICNNIEHPIPSQEINPSSQNIPQTRCAISLINRPQPCCCRDFSAALFLRIFLPHFFYRDFSAALFLPHFSADFSAAFFFALFLPHFFCRDFSVALFFYHTFSATLFLPHFFFFCYSTFSATLFLPHFFCCKFSLSIIPTQITFHKNRYSMIFKCV